MLCAITARVQLVQLPKRFQQKTGLYGTQPVPGEAVINVADDNAAQLGGSQPARGARGGRGAWPQDTSTLDGPGRDVVPEEHGQQVLQVAVRCQAGLQRKPQQLVSSWAIIVSQQNATHASALHLHGDL